MNIQKLKAPFINKKLLLAVVSMFFICGVLYVKGTGVVVPVSAYGGGVYTNICGSAGTACTSSCNALYKNCDAECKPDSGYCQAKANEWAFKHVCDGKSSVSCPNGLPEAKPPKVVKGGKVTVDGDGVKCNQTVQLDIHTVDCRVTSCSMSTLKGYLLWYSGACPQSTPTNTPTKTPTRTPTQPAQPTATRTPTGQPTATRTPTGQPTATRTPTGQPTATRTPSPTGQPTATVTSRPPTATPRPPTPTPDFNEGMCECDSMKASQIIAGQPAVFTAISKVVGANVSKAEAKQIEFALFAGNNPASRKLIAGPTRVNTTASGTASEMKYQAQWKVPIPSTVQKGVDYLARATIKCTPKKTAQAYPYTALVLGESESKGLFAMIGDWIRNLFGGASTSQDVTSNESDDVSVQDTTTSSTGRNQLQLGTFAPAKVIEEVCPIVKFRFE